MSMTDEPCLACTLMGRDFVERKEAISRELFAHAEQFDELPDGFAYRFPSTAPWPATALSFIEAERQCCPFFTFELVFAPDRAPLWLRLRGSDAIKAFVRAELDEIAPSSAART
jgi:hypothetical protein